MALEQLKEAGTVLLNPSYHIWLIWSGLTTNEKFRKTDVMNFYYSRKQLVEKKLTFIEKVILDKQAEKAAKEKSGLKTVAKEGLTAQGEEAEPPKEAGDVEKAEPGGPRGPAGLGSCFGPWVAIRPKWRKCWICINEQVW